MESYIKHNIDHICKKTTTKYNNAASNLLWNGYATEEGKEKKEENPWTVMGTKNIEFENIPQNCVSTYARLRYTAVVIYV